MDSGPYRFSRKTDRQGDTLLNDGYGSPVNPVGLIVSSFRPSDDATLFGFLIPSNMVCRHFTPPVGRDDARHQKG